MTKGYPIVEGQRILVCGGRTYAHAPTPATPAELVLAKRQLTRLFAVLDDLNPSEVCEGGALGADHAAGIWAKSREVPLTVFEANWIQHGRAAGPIRNRKMLITFKPDLVVAFQGGRGTENMKKISREAGVPVLEFH